MENNEKLQQLKQLGYFLVFSIGFIVAFYYLIKIVPETKKEFKHHYEEKVGKIFVINVPGRVSIEYRWQINKEKSKGLDLFKIDHIGWRYPKDERRKDRKSAFGAPRTAKFYVRPKAPGSAKLTFEYKRRGIDDDPPQIVKEVTINVSP